ncbi:antirestriction protein ArdA [Campylobacter hyointestinalis]|uniref:antirestriction protein ArdA n=1 Tax=Campylobacter hyointestinalis TaxID=198 RepID=UPI0011ADBFF5|nr:antirestriction protein ArdA [Campylobacter hyointestinalis]TWO28050.1 antirestriction protein ArdA [Campylobacter hyointestinalis]
MNEVLIDIKDNNGNVFHSTSVDLDDFNDYEEIANYLVEDLRDNVDSYAIAEEIENMINDGNYDMFVLKDSESGYYQKGSSLEDVFERYEILKEYDEDFLNAYQSSYRDLKNMDNNELSDLENFSLYRGSAKEYAKNLIEDIRSWNGIEIPEEILQYLDYESIANDLIKGGEVVETNEGVLVEDGLGNNAKNTATYSKIHKM